MNSLLKSWLTLAILLACALPASAVDFNVSSAGEFQAALNAAAANASDNEIVLESGTTYAGDFFFRPLSDTRLVIRGALEDATWPVISDGHIGFIVVGLSVDIEMTDLIFEGADFDFPRDSLQSLTLTSVDMIDTGIPHLKVDGAVRLERVKMPLSVNIWGNKGYDETHPNASLTILNSTISLYYQDPVEYGAGIVDIGGALSITDSQILLAGKFGVVGTQHFPFSFHAGVIFLEGNSLQVKNPTLFELSPEEVKLAETLQMFGSRYAPFQRFEVTNNKLLGSTKLRIYHPDLLATGNTCDQGTLALDPEGREGSSGASVISGNKNCRLEISAEHMIVESNESMCVTPESDQHPVDDPVDGSYCVDLAMYGTAKVRNNTFSELEISGTGDLTVENNIIWSAEAEASVMLDSFPDWAVLSNNIINGYTGYWNTVSDNLIVDPEFFDVANGDFHVTMGSPAINAGLNTAVTDPEATDLDGNPRILNDTVDIGAYERSTTALHPADSNGDGSISLDEFNAYNEAWRENVTWPAAPSQIPVDFVTRAGYLLQKGGSYHNIGVGKPATWVPADEHAVDE
mgnify:CR=1 FL=1